MNEESTPREGAEQIETLEARIRELEAKLAAAGAAGNSEKQINAAIEERAERLFEELKPYLEKYRSGGDELLRRVRGEGAGKPRSVARDSLRRWPYSREALRARERLRAGGFREQDYERRPELLRAR